MSTNDQDTVTVDLNIRDDERTPVDGTTAEISRAGVSDIIDHAAQLVLDFREGKDIYQTLDELGEALTVHGVIGPDPNALPNSAANGEGDSTYQEVRRGPLMVEFHYEGEGWQGEYDPTDPQDEPLLRFTVWDGEEQVPDASYCTRVPATTDTIVVRAAAWSVMNAAMNAYIADRSMKREMKRMSWISPEAVRLNGIAQIPSVDQHARYAEEAARYVIANASNEGCDDGLWVTRRSAVLAMARNNEAGRQEIASEELADAMRFVAQSENAVGCDDDLTVVSGLDTLVEQFNRMVPDAHRVYPMADTRESTPTP